ncbi:MAG TPA: alpha/beta hydrolase [Humisphaera sp.]
MRTTRADLSLALLLLALPAAALAAEPRVRRDVPYAEPKSARRMLDVYSPAEGKGHPIVVWVHGGGWKAGDKGAVQKKPQAFTTRSYVFVSTTYRFVPDVKVKAMAGDVARAIRWCRDHAAEIGGDPDRVVVMGHSAGAHLAALVCTDDAYLKAEGMPLSAVKACVPVDVSVYDIPKRLADGGSVAPATFTATFGESAEAQRDLSPAAHVAKGKDIPPFLILHVADRADTKAQSHWFAGRLTAAGVPATVVAAEGKTHGTIGSDLGVDGDGPTRAVFEFLENAVGKRLPPAPDPAK